MNADHVTRVIQAAHKLAALGLHSDYAELALVKNLARLKDLDPAHVAGEIYSAAPASWKRDLPAEDEAKVAAERSASQRELASEKRVGGAYRI